MSARLICLLLMCLLPWQGAAQGFAGLGTDADGFAIPQPGYVFEFPKDHGAHPSYRIEWWYLTANLRGADGRAYGIQWTLFRSALAPRDTDGWASPQIWFAHAGLTTPEAHFAAERFARGGTGQAGVTAAPFSAWIDEWQMHGPDIDTLQVVAQGADFGYDLSLATDAPLIFHGDAGYSTKSAEGQASYYYSQPRYSVTGTLTLPEGPVAVTGSAWLDREWSSQPLSDSQSGWDWFSLSFDGGAKLMGFQVRNRAGVPYTSGTWIASDGGTQSFGDGALRATPLAWSEVAGRRVPTSWRVELAQKGVDVEVSALNPKAWMGLSIAYWEGPVTVQGSHAGVGYLEMTGYE